ncbi:AAA family ATPase [Actinosynnema pretiosum subsp. pretiosum]|uniref:AAA family ATPase n=1 Tax=Actinosynnema pretiosum subsp. pretiosum TaxID=103721 RepID=A0AA45L8C4_9PSEU|nr:AAA family ATPase [Actinosynnema pretiosum subsp. pretiosum]
MPSGAPLRVALLGPVRAWLGETEVDVGAARRRAVFAVLAVRAGQTVARDELVDGVWGDAPPATAGASLYTYVSGLRRAFDPDRSHRAATGVIDSVGAGYALRLEPDGLDVHRFEAHRERAQELAAADPAGALRELDEALGLWRGDALSGVPGPFAEAQRSRLAELRLAAVERRAELALGLGRHADVVAELTALTADHPMREGLRALLMQALHRGGRQAEALEVFRDARDALVEQLGIEPGPALRHAHSQVLGDHGSASDGAAWARGADLLPPRGSSWPGGDVSGGDVSGGGRAGGGPPGGDAWERGGSGGNWRGRGGQAGADRAGGRRAGSGQAGVGRAGAGQTGGGRAGDGRAEGGQAGSGRAGASQAGGGRGSAGRAGSGFPGDGSPGAGRAGSGRGSADQQGGGFRNDGSPGGGPSGAGSSGAGSPGAGSPGAGSPGAGSPGAGSPGAGSPGAGLSGAGLSGVARAGAGRAGSGFLSGGAGDGLPGWSGVDAAAAGEHGVGRPALSTPTAVPRGFAGRARELAALRAAVAEVVAGRGGAVWVEGEPGIGKSALLDVALDARDVQLGWARGDELGGRFPLRVVLDCLDVSPCSADPRRVALAAALDDPASWFGDPVAAAAERLTGFVAELCAAGPVVLVVDDAQWADEASVAVWRRLLGLTGELPLLLVAAARPVPRRGDVDRVRRAAADRGGLVLGLGPLSEPEVAGLLAEQVGAAPGPELLRLAGCAGGNPLYVRELADALVREGALERRGGVADVDDVGRTASPSLVAALGRRLSFLSDDATEVLRRAALLGDRFAVADVATALGTPASGLLGPLSEATESGLLVDGGELLAFRHPLVRQVLYLGVPEAVRSALHRQAARALAEAGAAVAVVAGQIAAAPELADDWVVDWLTARADPLAAAEPEAAVELLRSVARQPALEPAHRERLLAALARLLFLLGERPDAEVRYVLARSRDADRIGEMRWMLARLQNDDGEPGEASRMLAEAIADPASTPVWRARMRALLAVVHREGLDDVVAAEAHALAVPPGDRFADGLALRARWQVAMARRDHAGALARAEEGAALVAGDPVLVGLWHELVADRAEALRALDRFADADAVLRAGRADAPGSLVHGAALVRAAEQDYWTGRWDRALERAEDGVARSGSRERGRVLLGRGIAALVRVRRGLPVRWDGAPPPVLPAHHEQADFLAVARALAGSAPVPALVPLLRPRGLLARHRWMPLLTRSALVEGARDVAERALRVCLDEGAEVAAAHCRGLLAADPSEVLVAAGRYRAAGRTVDLAGALEDAAVLLGDEVRLAEAVEVYRGFGAEADARRARARFGRLARGAR